VSTIFHVYLGVLCAGITLRACEVAWHSWAMKRLEERMRKTFEQAASADLVKAYRAQRAARRDMGAN